VDTIYREVQDILQLEELDARLKFQGKATVQKILNYCNQEELPAGLRPVVVEIMLILHEQNTLASGEGELISIKESDTEFRFSAPVTKHITLDGILGDYRAQLNRFRRVRSL